MLGVSVGKRLRHGSLTNYNEAHTVSYSSQSGKFVARNEQRTRQKQSQTRSLKDFWRSKLKIARIEKLPQNS